MTVPVFTNGDTLCADSLARINGLEQAYSDFVATFDPVFDLFTQVKSSIDTVGSSLRTASRTADTLGKAIKPLPATGPAKLLKEVSELALGTAEALTGNISKSLRLLELQLAPLFGVIEQVKALILKPYLVFSKARDVIVYIQEWCIKLIPQENWLITTFSDKALALDQIWDRIRDMIDRVITKLEAKIRKVTETIQRLVARLRGAIEQLANLLPGFERFREILAGLNARVEKLMDLAGPVLEKIDEALDKVADTAGEVLDWLQALPGVGDAVREAREAASGALDALGRVKNAMQSAAAKAIQDIGVLDAITVPINAMLNYVTEIAGQLQDSIGPVINRLIRRAKKMMRDFSRGAAILKKFFRIKPNLEVDLVSLRNAIRQLIDRFRTALQPDRKITADDLSRDAKRLGHILGQVSLDAPEVAEWKRPVQRSVDKLAAAAEFAAESETNDQWEARFGTVNRLHNSLNQQIDIFVPQYTGPDMAPGYFDQLAEILDVSAPSVDERLDAIWEVEEFPEVPWLPLLGNRAAAAEEPEEVLLPPYEPDQTDMGPLIESFIEHAENLNRHQQALDRLLVREMGG